jgi:DNA-directed RNA polymerase beta subunit
MDIRPIVVDARTRRDHLREKTVTGLTTLFPLVGRDHDLVVENVRVKPAAYSSNDQKTAILHGRTLSEPVVGDLVLKDKNGKVVDTKKGHILAHLPYFTERHSMIVGGNEYEVPNQLRLKPGVYTRERGNGEFEAAFNLSKGDNFRISMEPETGKLRAEFGTTTVPLRPVLKALGISDATMKQHWGADLHAANLSTRATTEDGALNKLVTRLKRPRDVVADTTEAKQRFLHEYFDKTRMDADVNKQTLGHAFDRVTPMAMLEASKKLIRVHKGDDEGDDRDSLEFKTIHTVDDFFQERLEKDAKRTIAPKLVWKINQAKGRPLKEVIPNSAFTRSLTSFLTTSALSAIPTQYNPVELIDHASKITSLGEGGISSDRAIPFEARKVHNTHLGILDPVRTPESGHAGIDVRAAMGAHKDKHGNLYGTFRNAKTGKVEPVSVMTLARSVVGFSGQEHRKGMVDAVKGADNVSVPRSQVDYWIEDPTHQFSPSVALVPFLDGMQGNRAIMGSKFQTQALPLLERDVPYVQAQAPRSGQSMTQEIARLTVPTSGVHGVIAKVDANYIYIRPDAKKHAAIDWAARLARLERRQQGTETPEERAEYARMGAFDADSERTGRTDYDLLKVADYDGLEDAQIPEYLMGDEKTAAADDDDGLIRLPYDTHFPLAAKTYLHNTVKVKAGDRVTPGQMLADSNFTKDDHIALGKNLTTGYLAYYGKNSNDAVVISETAAKKLTSEHMYKETLRKGSDTIQSKAKYVTYYGMRFTKAQLDKLDDNGVAKPGVKLDPGDPILLALEKSAPSPDAMMLGHLHKSLVKPYRDASITWEHHTPGEVVEAVNAARQAVCTVRTHEPMKIGDKLANRFGGKGVVSEIVPDHKMVQDERKKPIDVLFTSAGIVSRINPAQVVEAALGKVVEKTGKPYVLAQFMQKDNVQFAKDELKKHGVKDKETVYDPVSGREIPNVFVGRSYIHKLFKSTESNYAARGVTNYDVNLQPTKGGDEGAKGLGKMEINTLLAHNARNVLKEALTIKSEKSDEYWRAMEFGLPPPPPKSPFVAEKFKAMMTGAGINVDKRGTTVSLGALTDKHVTDMSSGALTLPELEKSKSFMVTAKDLKPERGGLFDPVLTGGLGGTRWAHIDLPEPTLNPVFEDPARRLLGMTKSQIRTELAQHGGTALRTKLNDVDLAATEKKLLKKSETARGADLDNVVKQLKYIRALRDAGHTQAGDAYVVSKIPVIPPVMRPILPSQKNGELQIADANYLYRDLALAASGLRSAKETGLSDLTASARAHMYDASSALSGIGDPVSPQLQGRGVTGFITQIAGQGSPKQGFLFKKILKRQQDLSMRATATPDNTLDMDQIGVPEDMLWKTYDKFIMKGLIGQGYAATRAKEMIEARHPIANQVLQMELSHRPVFVNRAPSLHKHNMVAAFPVAVSGKSLRINPFMEKGQNLDYDGDTMQLHVPVGNKAVAEARELTLSKLLFSDKSRDDLMIFPQHEAIIGAYLATAQTPKGPKKKFKTKADAMAAYRRGEITLETPVEIG